MKVNAADAAKKAHAKPRDERPETSPSAPPVSLPPLPALRPAAPLIADAFANLVSRQFDRDREAVLRRARDAGVAFCVVASADVEKQSDVAALCREFAGRLYCVAGALPDNIKRTCNDKQLATWLAAVSEVALQPECVAVQAGLDLGREAATHHAQERLFDMHAALAKRVGLPLLVHAAPGSSLERATELLAAVAEPPRFALLNAALHCAAPAEEGEADLLDAWREAGGWLVVSGALLSEPGAPGAAEATARLGAFARQPEALLLATGSPQHTPQTLADSYLRTMRNEPSNAPQILADLAAAAGDAMPAGQLAEALWRNALQFFALTPATDAAASTPASPPAKATKHAAGEQPGSSPAKAPAAAASATESESDDEDDEEAAPVRPAARRPNASAFAQLALDEEGASSSASDEDDADEGLAARRRAATRPEAEEEEAQWACRRCRARLFVPRAVVWHGVGGDRAAFAATKAADDNSCLASVFVACADAGALAALGIAAADTADAGQAGLKLACARCGAKLGRFADAPQPCSCGALVPGPAAKLTAARLDFVDAHAAGDALRLRGELDAAAGADRDAEAAAAAAEAKRRKEAQQKPKQAKQSGGNFSNYRNKTT